MEGSPFIKSIHTSLQMIRVIHVVIDSERDGKVHNPLHPVWPPPHTCSENNIGVKNRAVIPKQRRYLGANGFCL